MHDLMSASLHGAEPSSNTTQPLTSLSKLIFVSLLSSINVRNAYMCYLYLNAKCENDLTFIFFKKSLSFTEQFTICEPLLSDAKLIAAASN